MIGNVDSKLEEELISGLRDTELLGFDPAVVMFPYLPTKTVKLFKATRSKLFQQIDQCIADKTALYNEGVRFFFEISIKKVTTGKF